MTNKNVFSSGYSSFNQSSTDDETNEMTLVARGPRVTRDYYENTFAATNIRDACRYEIDRMTLRSFNETVYRQNQTGSL
jgi:hypothetical protein